jgi:CHAD domain-containing protein
MGEKPGLRPEGTLAEGIRAVARDILEEARAALEDSQRTDATAVHDFRKAMKRWRAFLRLLEPLIPEAESLRREARDVAARLATARDPQAALDALEHVGKDDAALSARTLATIRGRLEEAKRNAERTTLTVALRSRLQASITVATDKVEAWALHDITFDALARGLTFTYRRARHRLPADWQSAEAEALHELRQRVVEHRYQMELVEPLWPKLGRLWVDEAQRLRDRLGTYQDLVVLGRLTGPHQHLAPWRSRLTPIIAMRQAALAKTAERYAGRLFAERPKAFCRRLEAMWESRKGDWA